MNRQFLSRYKGYFPPPSSFFLDFEEDRDRTAHSHFFDGPAAQQEER